MNQPIYLDYNATTPVAPQVAEAMQPYLLQSFGNPSSSHAFGRRARQAVETARRQVAALLDCDAENVVFTSGGSEANNWAVKGVAWALEHRGRHLVVSAVEHPSILQACAFLERRGWQVSRVPVDHHGVIGLQELYRAVRRETVLISVMLANNEVGTLQPIAEIAEFAHRQGILVHTDAAQAVGKIPVSLRQLGVDLLTVAGHKLYAPKGVGALILARGTAIEPLIHGAGQEFGRRAGTENVLEIVGLGAACELANGSLPEATRHMQQLRDTLQSLLQESLPDCVINGHPEKRLPNTLSVSFPGLQANRLLERLAPYVAASPGAACHSDRVSVSHVLRAMGLPERIAMGTVRFSTGRMTTEREIRDAAQAIVRVVQAMRKDERGAGEATS